MLHIWVLKPFALDKFKTCQNACTLHTHHLDCEVRHNTCFLKISSQCMQQLCGLFSARNWQICRFPIKNKRIECGTMALVASQKYRLPSNSNLKIVCDAYVDQFIQVFWASGHIRTRFPNAAKAQAEVNEVAEADGAESRKSCRACSSSAWARPSLCWKSRSACLFYLLTLSIIEVIGVIL